MLWSANKLNLPYMCKQYSVYAGSSHFCDEQQENRHVSPLCYISVTITVFVCVQCVFSVVCYLMLLSVVLMILQHASVWFVADCCASFLQAATKKRKIKGKPYIRSF